MIKLIFLLFISLIVSNISVAKNIPCWKVNSTLEVVKYKVPNFIERMKSCSKERDENVQYYLETLKTEKLKDNKTNAALATGITGELYSKFMQIPQKYVNDLTLSACERIETKRRRPGNCTLIYEGKKFLTNGWVPFYDDTCLLYTSPSPRD